MTVTRDDAQTFAARQHRVELNEVLSNPFSRPVGWALLLGALSFTLLFAPQLAVPVPPAAALAVVYLSGLAALGGIWHLTAPAIEARGFRRAARRWQVDFGGGAGAGAYADLDRSGRLTLYSVWADPRNQGHGTQLLNTIIAETAPAELWLTADNRRVEAFYRRCGFVTVGRRITGHRMLLQRGRRERTTTP